MIYRSSFIPIFLFLLGGFIAADSAGEHQGGGNLSQGESLSTPADSSADFLKDHLLDVAGCSRIIGMKLPEAIEIFGVPEEVFPLRSSEEWQDDVVFYYPNHFYLFWYKNRVWQFRLDKRAELTVLGLRMGMDRADVAKTIGDPFREAEGSWIYLLPGAYELESVKLRARLFFNDHKLNDIYIYRGDF